MLSSVRCPAAGEDILLQALEWDGGIPELKFRDERLTRNGLKEQRS